MYRKRKSKTVHLLFTQLNAGRLSMSREISLAREASVAHLADIRPLPGVAPPVYGQRRPLTEGLRTLVALVGLFARVDPLVHPQILRVREALATDVADVGLLPGVYPPVFLQVLGTAQALAAIVAQIQLGRIVALLVPEQRSLGSQHPTADVASRARHFRRLELRVQPSAVGSQLSPQEERARAGLTNEGLVARVYVVVLLELLGLTEVLVTLVALEGQLGLVGVPGHVDAQGGQHRCLVVALLADVARQEVGLLVTRQVSEEPELLRAVFAGELACAVACQVLLVVAPVSEHLAAGLASVLVL